MIINLDPIQGLPGSTETVLSVYGDLLVVDSASYDLSAVPEGGEALAAGDHPFIGPIRRTGGVIECTLRVQLGDDAAPDQPPERDHWRVNVDDGAVEIPAIRKEVSE